MRCEIVIKPAAEKCLDKIPRPVRSRIADAMEELCDDPRPPDAVKLAARENVWRIRIGDYRVVYEIHDERLLILILRVAHRKDVYRP